MITINEFVKSSPLYNKNKKIILYKGSLKPKILFIGLNPEKEDDRFGYPFSDRSGKIVNNWITSIKKNNEVGVFYLVPLLKLNQGAISIKPSKNEIEYFRPLVDFLMNRYKSAKIVFTLGKTTTQYFLKKDFHNILGSYVKNNKKYFIPFNEPSYYMQKGINSSKIFLKYWEEVIEPLYKYIYGG